MSIFSGSSKRSTSTPDTGSEIDPLLEILAEICISNNLLRSANRTLTDILETGATTHNKIVEISQTLETVAESRTIAPATVLSTPSTITHTSARRTRERVLSPSQSSHHPTLDRNATIDIGDEVVIIHRFAGQFGIIGTVYQTTTAYVHLRSPTGATYKKRRDKVALYIP